MKKATVLISVRRFGALMLAFACLFSLCRFPAKVEAVESDEENYEYSVTISFGTFDFYYDWGVWDADALKYAASTTSTSPAAGTVAGDPGWYGFDGVANKISVEFLHSTSLNTSIDVGVY